MTLVRVAPARNISTAAGADKGQDDMQCQVVFTTV